jgi:hypothetical protein
VYQEDDMVVDPLPNAQDERSGFEKFLGNLPGVKGYREKEMRRDADRQVRDALARRLESRRAKLTALQGDLLDGGGLQWVDDVERVVGRLQLFIDRVKTASYGYAPLWGLDKVDETDLDRLAVFDQDLFEQVPPLDEALAKLEEAVAGNTGIKEALKAVGELVTGLNETFNRRSDVIKNIA